MSESIALPYRPSWIDRANEWLDRLPGPTWSYHLGLALILLLAQSAVLWIEGASPVGTLIPAYGFLAGGIAFILALLNYLAKRAEAALATLRPALIGGEKEYEKLRLQLTTMPSGRTLAAGIITLGIVMLSEMAGEPYHLGVLEAYPLSAALLRILYLIIWWIFGTLLYHTIHQLRLINRIYTQRTRINIFRMKPLYAFSSLTAFTAGSLTVLPYGFLLANDIFDLERLDPIALALILGIQVVAVITFIWPQLGIHRLQAAEKDRLLDEANQRFESTILELHRRVDDRELEKIGELKTTLSTLQMELEALRGIPTWPWQPETVRWLITALVLPLGLWLIQSVLQRVMSP